MRIKMYSRKNICVVPTYNCNAACPFCYAKELKRRFRKDMGWQTFKKIMDTCLNSGINEVSFLGGEPTIWPHINKAVSYLKKKKVQVNFFTNGLIPSQISPDCVLINIYNFFDEVMREKIKKTIHFYKSQDVEIGLRYNLVAGQKNHRYDQIFFDFAMALANYISISPAVPYRPSKELGNRLFKLAQKFHVHGKQVKISRAIPICLFNSEQFQYLRDKCNLHTECYSQKNIVINPDGETIFPCVNVNVPPKSLYKDGFEKINNCYKDFFECLSKSYFLPQCKKCEYFLNHRCWGGCLGMRSAQNIKVSVKNNFYETERA